MKATKGKMTFNIVFTPGNVFYLRLFTLSLLRWSDCIFRLVSNGCSEEEKDMLRLLCDTIPNLEYFDLPYEKMVRHGTALNLLQKMEESPFFCFMDSDIFATGDFVREMKPYLEDYCMISSCAAIWTSLSDQIMKKESRSMGGSYHWSYDNLCLGSTYFCMYNNNVLKRILEHTGITFSKYADFKKIPPQLHNEIERLGLKMRYYDTGKVLNILMLARGEKTLYKESNTLCHIGGLSSLLVGPLASLPQKKFKRLLTKKGIRNFIKTTLLGKADNRIKYERRDVSDYFSLLLQALFEERLFDKMVKVHDMVVQSNIKKATSQLKELYAEYREILHINSSNVKNS